MRSRTPRLEKGPASARRAQAINRSPAAPGTVEGRPTPIRIAAAPLHTYERGRGDRSRTREALQRVWHIVAQIPAGWLESVAASLSATPAAGVRRTLPWHGARSRAGARTARAR